MFIVKAVSETVFLKSGLTKSFTVCNFRKKKIGQSSFFLKCLKFDIDSRNGRRKLEKIVGFKYNFV